jgi:hypothetical protein
MRWRRSSDRLRGESNWEPLLGPRRDPVGCVFVHAGRKGRSGIDTSRTDPQWAQTAHARMGRFCSSRRRSRSPEMAQPTPRHETDVIWPGNTLSYGFGYAVPGARCSKHLGQMPCVMKWRRPVTNACGTTSGSSQIPSMERLPHQAQTVTFSGESCRDGARGLGAPAAASGTRGGFMLRSIFLPVAKSVKPPMGSVLRWHLRRPSRTHAHAVRIAPAWRRPAATFEGSQAGDNGGAKCEGMPGWVGLRGPHWPGHSHQGRGEHVGRLRRDSICGVARADVRARRSETSPQR